MSNIAKNIWKSVVWTFYAATFTPVPKLDPVEIFYQRLKKIKPFLYHFILRKKLQMFCEDLKEVC